MTIDGITFKADTVYKVKKNTNIRTAPEVGDKTKVKCKDLKDNVKDLCKNQEGYGPIKQGSNFHLMEYYKIDDNVWTKTKSGYYFVIYFNGKVRIEKDK